MANINIKDKDYKIDDKDLPLLEILEAIRLELKRIADK